MHSKLLTQTAFTEHFLEFSLLPWLFTHGSAITFGGSCLLFLLFTYLSLDWILLDTEHISFTFKTTAPKVMNNYVSLQVRINKHLILSLIYWNFQLRRFNPGIHQSHCFQQQQHETPMMTATISLFTEDSWKNIFGNLISYHLISILLPLFLFFLSWLEALGVILTPSFFSFILCISLQIMPNPFLAYHLGHLFL